MSVVTRTAVPDDSAALVALLVELTEHDGAPPPAMTEAIMRRDGFGPHRYFEPIIAVDSADGRALGTVILLRGYSTRVAQPSLTVHVLVVSAAARGKGVGRALITHVAGIAAAEGCGRVDLSVLTWNEAAQRFYAGVGFRPVENNLPLRLNEAGIQALLAASDANGH